MNIETVAAMATAVIAGLGALAMWVTVKTELASLRAETKTRFELLGEQMSGVPTLVDRISRMEEQVRSLYRVYEELRSDVDGYHKS